VASVIDSPMPSAVDGLEGIEKAISEEPDLILMDMDMPKLDGWEATRRLKADTRTAGTPVLALTAHAMVSDRARAESAGCDDYDSKPIDLKRLLQKMSKLLEAKDDAAPDLPSTTG
jgi:CheY-like chemotaxis protein